MKQFKNKVYWEFNSRLCGYGRDVKEAMLDALSNKAIDVIEARPTSAFIPMIEDNEVFYIDERRSLVETYAPKKLSEIHYPTQLEFDFDRRTKGEAVT